jgi:Rrf2 family nitric oxide-sensitive transcriptional repressor
MRVSQRVDYSLRMLVALASLGEGERVPTGELAAALDLPRRFSEQQITELARDGIVSCQAGANGGCRLEVSAADLTVGRVVRALEGEVLDVPRTRRSATAEMWANVASGIEEDLDAVTIADLAERQSELDLGEAAMYHI